MKKIRISIFSIMIIDIILIILLVIVPTVVIAINFGPFKHVSAGEWISYIGTIIAAIAAVSLGMLTIYINENDRIKSEKIYRNEKRPFFIFTNAEVIKSSDIQDESNIKIWVKNKSNFLAYNVSIICTFQEHKDGAYNDKFSDTIHLRLIQENEENLVEFSRKIDFEIFGAIIEINYFDNFGYKITDSYLLMIKDGANIFQNVGRKEVLEMN